MWVRIFILFLPVYLLGKEPVYFLHGFMRQSTSMKPMAKVFQKEGYETYTWGYPSREKTIQEHADDLIKDLQKTADLHPGQPIHFVTHSLGGIIVRCALNHPDCPVEAKKGRAVLLVPPNRGSRFGRALNRLDPLRKIVGNKAGKQIFTAEDFDSIGSFPESMEVLVISGTFGWNPVVGEKNDGKVGVSESCLETPHKHMTVFSGHSWIMYSHTVIYNALKFISS